MGGVKRDLTGKEMFYRQLSLSDTDVIRLLIEYRYKYDKYAGFEVNNMFDQAGLVEDMNQEILATYSSLDVLIKQCNFSKDQLKIIKMTADGYTLQEIAHTLGLNHVDNIQKRMNKICKDISKMNLWNWRKTTYKNELDLKTKICSKCKEELPATDEFFIYDSTNNTYKSACKNCKNKQKD